MSNTCDGEGISSQGLSPLSAQEKGNKNKRKFLSSELPLDPRPGVSSSSSSSLTEFPRYELLEQKFRNAMRHIVSTEEIPDQPKEGGDVPEAKVSDWDDPIISELEVLLSKGLSANFQAAIKKVYEYGVSEEVAEWVILRSGPFYGNKDPVSNIVDRALAYLRREKESSTSKIRMFEDLPNLVEYTMLEMICVLIEVKPFLSVAEAMWCLLLCDLNLGLACAVEGHPLSSYGKEDVQGEKEGGSSSDSTPIQSHSQPQNPEKSIISNPDKPNTSKPSNPNPQNSQSGTNLPNLDAPLVREVQITEKEIRVSHHVTGEQIQTTVVEEKSGVGRKAALGNSKRDVLRQKTFHFEKSYKGRMSKGSFKAKLTTWGGLVLDKKSKSPSDCSADANMKNSPTLPLKDTVSALPAPSTKPPKPTPSGKAKPTTPKPQTTETSIPTPPKDANYYYAGIPYDESLVKYVPQDVKDKILLALGPRLQALQKELKSWDDWAHEKVMQATRRLGKDQAELKTLRQEREETEKFKREKQILEESTVKRLSEMEYALSTATGQIEMANSTVGRLEGENSVLKKEMDAAKEKSSCEAAKLEEAVLREQEALKKFQSCGPQKGLLQEELTTAKGKAAEVQQKLEKAKALLNQIEAQQAYEERETAKYLRQAKCISEERERLEALAKAEEEKAQQKAENELKKYNDRMEEIQNEISSLKLECETQKIAALTWTPKVNNKRLEVFRNNFGGDPSVKQDRECVMCLSEEKSVVFLPCAHQVLCANCNEIHEKQGVKDCPSCRTLIEKRIHARFANS